MSHLLLLLLVPLSIWEKGGIIQQCFVVAVHATRHCQIGKRLSSPRATPCCCARCPRSPRRRVTGLVAREIGALARRNCFRTTTLERREIMDFPCVILDPPNNNNTYSHCLSPIVLLWRGIVICRNRRTKKELFYLNFTLHQHMCRTDAVISFYIVKAARIALLKLVAFPLCLSSSSVFVGLFFPTRSSSRYTCINN